MMVLARPSALDATDGVDEDSGNSTAGNFTAVGDDHIGARVRPDEMAAIKEQS
jgi:hypothetical protein